MKNWFDMFLREKYFSHNGCQSCLIFHPLFNKLKLWNLDYVKVTASKSLGIYREKFQLFLITVAHELEYLKMVN